MVNLRERFTKRSLKVKMPIGLKITLPYIILVILIALGAAYVVTRIVFDTSEERFTNQLIETGKLASEWVVREENRLLETLRQLMYTQGMVEAVLENDAERLHEMVLPVAANDGQEAVEILGLDGIAVISLHHKTGGNLEEYYFSRGNDELEKWTFVQNVLQQENDSTGDKYSGIVQASWGDFIYVAGPLYDEDDNLVGIVLVGESLLTFVQGIRQATLAQVTLYNFEGRPLATTYLEDPALDQEIVSNVVNTPDEGFSHNLSVVNISYREMLGLLELRNDSEEGILGTALPHTFLVRANQVTRNVIYLLVAVGFLLVILVGRYLANTITLPLSRLVGASTEVAGGNLDVQVDYRGSDEIATLAQSFNRMVSALSESQDELLNAYDSTIEGWAKALELRDNETERHTQRVTELTLWLAQEVGISEEELVHLRRGAILHDIGKMGIPDGILLKPKKLTKKEWKIMRQHPAFARDMIAPIPYLLPAVDIPYCHHERWDGEGYPQGLKGEEIPLAARIFAVMDVWDALISERPYRDAWTDEKALNQIREGSGTHFDPAIVDVFFKLLEEKNLIDL